MAATLNFNAGDIDYTGSRLRIVDELGSTSYESNKKVDGYLYTPFGSGTSEYTFSVITYNDEGLLDENAYYELNGERTEIELNNDKKSTVPFKLNLRNGDILNIHCVIFRENPPPIKDVAGFNYVYLVDKDKLKSLAGERFEIITGEMNSELVDLGQFILNVLEVPFTVDSDVLGETKPIILGNVILKKTSATELITDRLELSLGDIEIPTTYHNSFDYINTTITLHLPYVEPIDLDVNMVIGETVSVEYVIDLYTGDTTVNVSTTKNEIVVSRVAKIGREIPFMKVRSHEMMFSNSGNYGIDNKVKNAFIEVSRNEPYLTENIFSDKIKDFLKLKNVTGFIRVNEIELKTNATFQEKSQIETLLRNGVTIK